MEAAKTFNAKDDSFDEEDSAVSKIICQFFRRLLDLLEAILVSAQFVKGERNPSSHISDLHFKAACIKKVGAATNLSDCLCFLFV